MDELTTHKPGVLTELFEARDMGFGRILASIGTAVVMMPLLVIALLPIALLMLLLLPPVGMWVAAGAMFGSDSSL